MIVNILYHYINIIDCIYNVINRKTPTIFVSMNQKFH